MHIAVDRVYQRIVFLDMIYVISRVLNSPVWRGFPPFRVGAARERQIRIGVRAIFAPEEPDVVTDW